jgi:lipopolysaccharide/colanic/teichoic acid biosynthesis glycosyltransferase
MDLSCCLIAFPALCVLTLVMVILHKLSSPGPVFFVQERVGYRGTRFRCFKFRTMIFGADTKNHQAYLDSLLASNTPMMKLDSRGDPRMVPGAWILRALGLDELPQIINVFRGDMSIVGPRPCLSYEYEKYQPWQRERFKAVPGLTGLWQVSGKNRTTFDQMIRLDIRYAENTSLWMDVRIISMTVPALFVQMADTRRSRKSKPPAVGTLPSIKTTEGVHKRARHMVIS